MEDILRSVLLRQKQMVMQWDAEFEQQKQLFHINTSTVIELLPIRSRKKRLKVDGRVQPGPIPSQDKENLVGLHDFLPNSARVKFPKSKAPYSRGFAKRDLNTRFCDNNVKDVGRLHSKPAESPRLQSARLNGQNVENVQLNGRVSRAVRLSNQDYLGVSLKIEVDEGDPRETRVSPSIDEISFSQAENRKRIRLGQEENIVLRTSSEENKELSNLPKEGRIGTDHMAVVDPAKKKSKPKRARVIGKAKENEAGMEKPVETCRDTLITRSREPEIAIKVEVEPEEQTCRDVHSVGFTEPDIASEGPAWRGRAKDAFAAVKAAAPKIVSKEPARRGRAKKALTASGAAVPEIAQRVTRSRARKVENVVESVTRTCEQMVASQVASKASVQQREEVAAHASPNVEDSSARAGTAEPTDGDPAVDCDAEGESRSANQIVEGALEAFCTPEVCAPLRAGVTRNEPSIKITSHSKERKSNARSRENHAESKLVACDTEKPRRVEVSSHADAHIEAASSHSGAEKQSARIGSRVAEILPSIGKATAENLKDAERESLPEPRLERIDEDVGHREADFASIEPPLASRCEGTEEPDGIVSLALPEALPAEEDTARNAHCSAASDRDTLIEVVSVDRTAGSRIQCPVTVDGRLGKGPQERLPGEAALLPLGKDPVLTTYATSIKAVSRPSPANTKEAYTTLLSEMIEGSVSPLEKLCGSVSSPESVVVASPRMSFLRSERLASPPVALQLPDAGKGALTSIVHNLPSVGMVRNSTVQGGSVDGRDGSGEHPMEYSITLASEGQGTGSDNVIEECSIWANIHLAERSWHSKGGSVEDAVVNITSESLRAKEPDNARELTDEAFLMDTNVQDQVMSGAVSPVRYSEARAIEEAMRCSLEQELHPDVTLTLDRWQFRKRLSPRSKARARRWRSDVAANGVDYGPGQPSDAPRVVSSGDRCMEGAAYETFLEVQSPNPEAALGGIKPAFISLAEKSPDQADPTSWQEISNMVFIQEHAPQPEGMARRSIAALCDEVLGQALHDGEIGDDSVEYEVMETSDDQNGNLSPLVRSIYTLSKSCKNDIVGVGGIFEEEKPQQVQTLIESAKKVAEQLSSKKVQAVGAPPRTPAANHPALNSSRFHDHTLLYPDRFRLFITPCSTLAAPPKLPPSASIFLVSATPAVASVLSGDNASASPQMKHLTQEAIKVTLSKAPDHESTLSESAVRADDTLSPVRSGTPRSDEVPRTSETGNIHHLGESESAPDCSDAVRSGSGRLIRTDLISVHLASDVHPSTIVRGTPAIGCASPLLGSGDAGAVQSCDGGILSIGDRIGAVDPVELIAHQSAVPFRSEIMAETEKLSELRSRCDGGILSIGDRIGAVDTVEVIAHQSAVPFTSEIMAETEKLSELRSRFYALSKGYVVGSSSTAKDVPNLQGAGSESTIKHSTKPPSLNPIRRFSAGYVIKHGKGGRESVKQRAHASKEVDLDAGENRDPAVVMEGETRILCSPIFIGNDRGQVNSHEDVTTDDSSLSQHAVQKTVAVKEEVVVLEGILEPSQGAVARTRSMATPSSASVLRVEVQRPFNLVGTAPCPVPNSSKLSCLNLVSDIRSFIPLVQQQQPAAPFPDGKRDVKVKALAAAEAAKRLAEQKELEKQERKKAAEIAKRYKQERAAHEKLAKREKAAQDKLVKQPEARAEKETEEASKRKAAAAGATKSTIADSSNCQGTSSQNVLLKVKKTYGLKLKMYQAKHGSIQEEQRRKGEECKEVENAARKRKHEAVEKKVPEEKRRRQEEVMKAHREMEERQRLELEKRAQKRKALEEMEKKRKAIDDELKRQKRLDKGREVEECRMKEQEELAWLDQKDVTRKLKEEAAKQIKLLETEGRQEAVKRRRPSEDPSMPATGPCHSFMASLHVAMGSREGVGVTHLSRVNNLVDPQRVCSHSLAGYPLRVHQRSGEGAGAAFPPCKKSQAAMRVPRTTPESAPGMFDIIGRSGKPSFRTPPEALGNSALASVVGAGCASSARAFWEENHAPQGQSGSRAAVAGGSKPCQPGQVGFAGPPGGVMGHRDKDVQSYEISPFRDSEDEDSDDEEKRSQKPIPQWARKENMWPQLVRQFQLDPDDIFVGANSCGFDEVFEMKGSKKRPDFKRRGSSGDWVKDCLTWQEQIQYKVAMGYLP